MNVLYIIPSQNYDKQINERMLNRINYVWNNPNIIIGVEEKSELFKPLASDHSFENLPLRKKKLYLSNEKIKDLQNRYGKIDNIVILNAKSDIDIPFQWDRALNGTHKIYTIYLGGYGFFIPLNGFEQQTFEYIRMPFSHLYRNLYYNDTNELGFRVPKDYQSMTNRQENHKLIVYTGGSACFDVLNLKGERFTDLVEKELNNRNDGNDYTVLNFGMPSNMIINELVTYTLYVMSLKPDMVISHTGWNDLFYGQCSDPVLQKEYHLNYQSFHNNQTSEISLDIKHVPKASARLVIETFFERLLQFKTLVENNGATFLFALQPYALSKKALSDNERKYLSFFYNSDFYKNQRLMISNLRPLFNKLRVSIEQQNCNDWVVDFDNIFSEIDEKTTCFGDICHTTQEGNEIISKQYINIIEKILLRT